MYYLCIPRDTGETDLHPIRGNAVVLGGLKNVGAYFDSDIQSSFLVYDALKFLDRKQKQPTTTYHLCLPFKVHPCIGFL